MRALTSVAVPREKADLLKPALVFLILILLMGVLEKPLLGTGIQQNAGARIVQSVLAGYIARGVVFIVLIASVIVAIRSRAPVQFIRICILLWMPVYVVLLATIPVLDGDVGTMFRVFNFFTVLVSTTLLACSPGIPALLFRQFRSIAFWATASGLVLYVTGNPFTWFSDGYGIMYTGVFPHKDQAATVAAIGLVIAIVELRLANSERAPRRRPPRYRLLVVILTLAVGLVMASTLSSLLGFLAAFWAISSYRLAISVTSLFSVTLPVLHPLYGALAMMVGKDPTFTGRTRLWEFTLERAMDHPILGHGFRHLSATYEWDQMLRREFPADTFMIPHAHNVWVEAFYKFGFIGLIILVWLLAIVPLCLKIPLPRNRAGTIARCLLVFFMMKAAFTMPFLNSDVMAYLWSLCLMVAVLDLKIRDYYR